MNCNKCSKEIPQSAAFCGYCGAANTIDTEQANINEVVEEKDAVTTQEAVSTDTTVVISNVAKDDTISFTEVKTAANTQEAEIIEVKPVDVPVVPAAVEENTVLFAEKPTEESQDESVHYSHNESVKEIDDFFSSIDTVPVVKTSTYFWMILVMLIPGLNVIMLLIWSFSEKINTNRRNLSRAALIWTGIFIVVAIICLIIAIFSILSYGSYFTQQHFFFNY